jgi:monolysocardiolipin acyltransferase
MLSLAKVLSVELGAGIFQVGMQRAAEKLSRGEWLHFFPEGTRSSDGKLQRMRIGVGALVAEVKPTPIVVPMFHHGLQNVVQRGKKGLGTGQDVKIVLGDPIDFSDILKDYDSTTMDEPKKKAVHAAISERVGNRLKQLEESS